MKTAEKPRRFNLRIEHVVLILEVTALLISPELLSLVWVSCVDVDDPHDLLVNVEPNSRPTGQFVLPTRISIPVDAYKLQLVTHWVVAFAGGMRSLSQEIPGVNDRISGCRDEICPALFRAPCTEPDVEFILLSWPRDLLARVSHVYLRGSVTGTGTSSHSNSSSGV
jgi:hypothetical protein